MKKSDIKKAGVKKANCGCSEFEFICEPDETGAIINHKHCDKMEFVSIEQLPEFKRQFPDTKIASNEDEVEPVVTEKELWAELLKEIPAICMYAPIHEPQRQNYIMDRIQAKYSIRQKSSG